jgi:hypothetical protein
MEIKRVYVICLKLSKYKNPIVQVDNIKLFEHHKYYSLGFKKIKEIIFWLFSLELAYKNKRK